MADRSTSGSERASKRAVPGPSHRRIRGVVFDLFDTLIDQDLSKLKPAEAEGQKVSPSTPELLRYLDSELSDEEAQRISAAAGRLDEAVDQPRAWRSLLGFAQHQKASDRTLFSETIAQGLELPTERRFDGLLARLGLEEGARRKSLAAGMTDAHMRVLLSAVQVPGHHESILAALAADYRLGVCSNFSHAETARSVLDGAGFTPHLDTIVISEELGIRKPRAEIYAATAEAMSLAPAEIVFVGDRLSADVAGPASAGMRTVWVTRQVPDPEAQLKAHEGPRPDFALEDLLDLPVLLARLASID